MCQVERHQIFAQIKKIAIEFFIQHLRVFSENKTTPKIQKQFPSLRMLRVLISLVELMYMEKHVTLTFVKAKKEFRRDLLREEGENAVNGSKDES